MKKFRKLVPALCMLLVSAVLMGTSTYAWFSMNKNVVADGMAVTAKSDVAWLQISNNAGASTDANKTAATADTANATVYPAKYNGTAGSDVWQYAYSNDPDQSTASGGYFTVADGDKGHYRLENTFKIGLKATEEKTAKAANLKVKTCKVTGTSEFLDAIGIVVVCGTNVQEIKANGQATGVEWSITGATVLLADVTETAADVKVYVYIDGDNDNVTTTKATKANLSAISVTLTFGVD